MEGEDNKSSVETERKPDEMKVSVFREVKLTMRKIWCRNDQQDVRPKTILLEETYEIPMQPLKTTLKYIAEAAEEYEAKIVKYAEVEIQKCKKETLTFLEDEVQKHKAEAFKRRIKITNKMATKIKLVQDKEMNFIAAELENTRKEP